MSDDSSNEDMSDNENKPSGSQKIEPRPPSGPISEDSRRHRRRHHKISEQLQESSKHTLQSSISMDASTSHLKKRQQQQSENEADSPRIDPYGSTTSLRRSGIFQSLRSKKDKVPLPRPSSARGREADVEKRQKKSQKETKGSLRPVRVSDAKP